MKKGLTTPNLPLLLAEVLVFAVCAVIASSHFGMADGLKITLAYLVAYLVPRTVLHHARGVSLPACVVLLVLAASLVAVAFLKISPIYIILVTIIAAVALSFAKEARAGK